MTTEQRILQIETELAALKADLGKEAPTMERHGPAKDWEIMEFKSTSKASEEGVIFHLVDGLYRMNKGLGFSLERMLSGGIDNVENGYWFIHSVRRLSDNTVWNVGQFVKPESPASKGWDRRPVHVIKYFHIGDSGQMYACCDSNFPVCGPIHSKTDAYKSGSFLLPELRPSSKPIFTTADGVELHDRNQLVYSVSISGTAFTGNIIQETACCIADWKRAYSTRLAAETAYNAWLAEQPFLSLNDISRFIDIGPYCELEALVKDKIAKR